jgi:arginyl-tRNA synthetase
VVRASNILAKLLERDGADAETIIDRLRTLPPAPIQSGASADELWGLVLEAGRLDEVVDTSIRTMELSVLAKYAFSLAQAFNGFYHSQQILKESNEDARLWRAAAVIYLRRQLARALELMGCDVPARM